MTAPSSSPSPTSYRNLILPTITKSNIDNYRTQGHIILSIPPLTNVYVNELRFDTERILRGDFDEINGVKRGPDKMPKRIKVDMPTMDMEGFDVVKDESDESDDVQLSKLNINQSLIDNPNRPPRKKVVHKIHPLGFTGNKTNIKVTQLINNSHSLKSYSQLTTSPSLGLYVAELCGWKKCGVRLVQDQSWLKPPGAKALNFHRDSPYFMFVSNSQLTESGFESVGGGGSFKRGYGENRGGEGFKGYSDICTVWVTLDDLTSSDLGPLEYVNSSHVWPGALKGDGPKSTFFSTENYKQNFISSALENERIDANAITFTTTVNVSKGGMSIHNGLCYHGSGPNVDVNNIPRRGIGIHYCRGDVKWDVKEARKSSVWREYVNRDVVRCGWVEEDGNGDGEVDVRDGETERAFFERAIERGCEVDIDEFPFVYRPES